MDTFDSWVFGDWWQPIILDLDGDGIDITPRDSSRAVFDLDGDLYDERTAWVGPGDGILVLNNPANDLPSGVVVRQQGRRRSPTRRFFAERGCREPAARAA